MITRRNWIRNTIPLWTGQFISLFGSGIVQFSIVWFLTEETGSKVVLAIATYVAIVPGILLGSFVGNIVDRRGKKATMLISDIISALLVFLMAVFLYFEIVSVPVILLILLVRSIANQFQSTALFSSIPLLVPDKSLDKVAGIRQTTDGILNLVAIPTAALLLAVWKIPFVLSIDLFTAFIGIVLLLFVAFPKGSIPTEHVADKMSFKSFIDGFQLLRSYKFIFYKSLLTATINLALTPAIAFLPLLVKENLNGGPETLAMLQVGAGLGTASGGLLMGSWGGFRNRMHSVLAGLALLGLSLSFGGILARLGLSVLLVAPMFLAGLGLSICNSSSGAITQSKVSSDHIGKVSGAAISISQLMIPLGIILATPISEFIGIPGWFIFSGLFCIAAVIIALFNHDFVLYGARES